MQLPIQSILIIRLSSIGDIVLTTPLIRLLAAAYPHATLDYCTKLPFIPLLAHNPRLSHLFTPELLPTTAYDLVVDLQNNRRSQLLVNSLKSRYHVAYHKENWKKWLYVHLKLNLYGNSWLHVVDRYRQAMDSFQPLADDSAGCELYPASEELEFAASVTAHAGKVLAICCGANHFTKRYPALHFATVVRLLMERHPSLTVLLLGGKEDVPQVNAILEAVPSALRSQMVAFAGECSLMQSAALLARSDAVLCNDTGLMHIASAFGKQLFVLFGSSVREFGFLPYHTPYELFEVSKLRCRPCSHIGRSRCKKKHFRCMHALSPESIAQRIHLYFEKR
uniref:Heptosyltransferase n=1 Tax=Chlorobium chlorochromatii (strain CaD3) TaxID=340177 RepID=Q3ANR6_CHLCH